MMPKLLTLVKSKTAVAVAGVLLVGGSGGAVAVAAQTGHLNGIGLQLATTKGDSSASDSNGEHAHAEGLLTACSTSGSISVTDEKGTVYTFNVTSDTKFVGDTHESTHEGSSTAGGASTNGTTHGDSSTAGGASTNATTHGDSSTAGEKSGANTASTFTLSDLCALVNKVKVQVQATAASSSDKTPDAAKVTVEGPGTDNSTDSNGSSGASTEGTPGAEGTHTPEGTPGAEGTSTTGSN